ncbi:EF hand [Teladorsagia circumcincta]|uniref:EF hand n=1 Tax=Teladorsagia circumcincta TaxID=45464 RepID=A0A2G9UFL0_TELCI|nr:EF hand [Teladorsagia circumcincta]
MAEDIEEILAEIDGEQIEGLFLLWEILSEYQKFFDDFDRGKQGYIMATQIGQIMRAMEQEFDEKTLRKLIRKFDADGSGKLEFDEFCALVYTVANTVDKDTLQKELRDAFRLFDKEVRRVSLPIRQSNKSIAWVQEESPVMPNGVVESGGKKSL